jgi:hypothetical protein
MRRSLRGAALASGAAVLLGAVPAAAQEAGRVTVTPHVGYVAWDEAAGIQDPVFQNDLCDFPEIGVECVGAGNNVSAGLSVLYAVRPQVRIGVSFEVHRPVANGAYFLPVELNTPGQARLVFVSQRLTVSQYAAVVEFHPVTGGRVSPFLEGGLGGYVLYLDPERSNSARRFHDLAALVGGGLEIPIGTATGFRLHVRDMILTGWDRDRLNVVSPEEATTRFPDLVPVPPEASSTLHNLWLSVGFLFRAGGR